MGCCEATQVNHEASASYMATLRSSGKANILILGIKDQNYIGKAYLCGADAKDVSLVDTFAAALEKTNPGVTQKRDDYDKMWDIAWRNTRFTSGAQAFSMTKPYFPRGKAVLGVLDALGYHGWVPTAAPNFGGPIDDDSAADWPTIIFGRDDGRFTKDNLFMAVKDQNVPGKLCAAGPADVIEGLKEKITRTLQGFSPKVEVGFDSYDTEEDWDIVWKETSITSGAAAFSMAKPYYPKGKVVVAIVEEVYKLGYRLVAAPNFGGNSVDWPCFIFRRLATEEDPPQILMGAIKDQNLPGKLTLAGREAHQVANALQAALKDVHKNESVTVRTDEYDADWDEVVRETSMTNGLAAFNFKLAYFPRNDAVMAMLQTLNAEGYSLAACPNFGGIGASWPSFIWEKTGRPVKSAFVAIKDQNIPGKVCFGGLAGEDVENALLAGFRALAGQDVHSGKESYDKAFDFCYNNTKMTSGSVPCSMQNAWWPFGYPLEMVLSELDAMGWKPVGGPNFGAGKLSWSSVVLEKDLSVVVAQAAPEQNVI
mmetsp:Transcript_117627/g.332765  ORF Transcript_117627/g.332765 Transcript_117627/m.332765 type:complete len:538 (-) Transcript_117627:164-1777(-)